MLFSGTILSVESNSIKASEGVFGGNQLDPEASVSTEDKKNLRRMTQIIRVFHIMGQSAHELIGRFWLSDFICLLLHVYFNTIIRKTCPCNDHPLILHFYVEKLGFAGVYQMFLFLIRNIHCGYSLEPPRTYNVCF